MWAYVTRMVCLVSLLWVTSVRAEVLPSIQFVPHVLNEDSQFSAATIMDVNRDGLPDIYCGGYWYESPRWNAHVTRAVDSIRGRFDDYANLPLDVNRDGWLDVISVNYRSESIYWVENPAERGGEWRKHLIDEPGPSETGLLVDLDQDGHLDLLPNGTRFASWYGRDFANGEDGLAPWFRRFRLPEQLAGHGIGSGDIDGDGRLDLVGPHGWWQCSTNPRLGAWDHRDEFVLHADCSIPILVHDVDRDGDADLIWARGHNVGIYWLEQRDDDSRRSWQLHVIDSEPSSVHTLMLADVDRDGVKELIAGKRYLGHDGKDPGEWMPLEINIYSYRQSRRCWQRTRVRWGGRLGIDLATAGGDLDGDGDWDFVAPSRVGLAWFENRTGESAAISEPLPPITPRVYRADEPLLQIRDGAQEPRPITNRTEWGLRRWQILQAMQAVMGDLPSSERRVPLDLSVKKRIPASADIGYDRLEITYRADGWDRVPALLLLPQKRPLHRTPAMLCLHPTHALGKGVVVGDGGAASRHYAHELAQAGFICLAPDYPSFGDYTWEFADDPNYVSGSIKAIWNNLRAVDLLESLPEVDRDRIGCIGHSLGGHNALFTAAMDERLRAVVTSCGFTAFADYYGGRLAGWTSERYMPRIRTEYHLDARQMPFDFHEILAAIAPRPIFVNAPVGDDNFAVDGVRRVIERVTPVYQFLDARERLTVRYPAAEHDFPDEVRQEAYAWLRAQFKLD